MNTPALPESAPFTSDQRNWLNGFLAGMANALPALLSGNPNVTSHQGLTGLGSNSLSSQPAPTLPLLILYGSQSGTSEGLALALGDKFISRAQEAGAQGRSGFNPKVAGLDHFRELNLAEEKNILCITSTWGDGDMPDNGVSFWNWFKSSEAPSLSHANFSILGLGDKSYARFCQAGKNLDQRFQELGANRILPLCECDTDYESKSETWMEEIISAIESLNPAPANQQAQSPSSNQNNFAITTSGSTLSTSSSSSPAKISSASTIPSFYNRKNPFPAALLENRPLNAKGSAKDTRHFTLSLLGSGLEYKVGDALGVFARNSYELVDRIILALYCKGNEVVIVDGGEPLALRTALIHRIDLRRGTEKLLMQLLDASTNFITKRKLIDLLANEGQEAKAYLSENDVLDVLEDFPQIKLEPTAFVSSLNKIAPRLYSISSSPNENPGEVHLTVGIVRYTVADRRRLGAASSYLAERVPLGMPVSVFVQPTAHFTIPQSPGIPIIMVGPGTGIAPFRAFLQERRNLGDTGKNWLFFGDQNRQFDFLYSEELLEMQSTGFLTRLDLAFSRDQAEKVYVQNRMLDQGKELFAWLEQGAYFYVCGDAKRMAKDVEAALLQIISKEGSVDPEQALAYLEKMKSEKRYQRDVY